MVSLRRGKAAFGLGALLAATFLSPVIGLISGLYHWGDFSGGGFGSLLAIVAEKSKPEWMPRRGHMLITVWPAPDAKYDKGCWEKLLRIEQDLSKPRIADAITGWKWYNTGWLLQSFDINLAGKLSGPTFWAIGGCIEGSILSHFCMKWLRHRVELEYDLARPRLERALHEQANKAELMACKVMDANSFRAHRYPTRSGLKQTDGFPPEADVN